MQVSSLNQYLGFENHFATGISASIFSNRYFPSYTDVGKLMGKSAIQCTSLIKFHENEKLNVHYKCTYNYHTFGFFFLECLLTCRYHQLIETAIPHSHPMIFFKNKTFKRRKKFDKNDKNIRFSLLVFLLFKKIVPVRKRVFFIYICLIIS